MRSWRVLGVLAVAGLALAACTGSGASTAAPAAAHRRPVHVLYAGSLVNVMEREIGPQFAAASGFRYQGEGGGSVALANEIKGKVKQADVFISAGPAADSTLVGAANGDEVSWFATFASSPLVIGYNPNSRFAADLTSKPWQQVLAEPGLRLGRTDPTTDPKGKLAVQALDRNGLAKLASAVTVLDHAPDQAGAAAFVNYLLGPDGTSALTANGFRLTSPPKVSGAADAVPAALHPRIPAS